MEAKAKSGAPAPKASSKAEKTEKKEAAPPKKIDPAQVEPLPPAAPVEEPQMEDGSAEPEGAPEGEEAAEASTDSLESLKPFLIGGAIIAAGAILLGALLLARRN
ncbi:cell cycle exit and neuronal differentiation protein 1-like [Oncorhynchus clarkii lewisi]|uniref:cell cycle exit and neuronal differentiation protein 1-like n=1 Tax=Oncorhynchus clarkii lewisi TaxID=490388 RepID=UPI0039B931A6